MKEVTLNQLKPGDTCTVMKVLGEGAVRRRIFDLGITPGASILYRKTAPFGDPIEISVRGYELSIRKEEAKAIIVKMQLKENCFKRTKLME